MLGLAFSLLLEFCNYYEKAQVSDLLEDGRPCEERPYLSQLTYQPSGDS